MHTTITALTLLGLSLAPTTVATWVSPPAIPMQDEESAESSQPEIGLSLFVPKHLETKALIKYARLTMASSNISRKDARDRLVAMEGAIGVQGTQRMRDYYVGYLEDLDNRLGAVSEARPETFSTSRSVRLRSMSASSAVEVVDALGFNITRHAVSETGTVLLYGREQDVAIAHEMILEADKPLPQMTLHCEVIEPLELTWTELQMLPPKDPARAKAAKEILTGPVATALEKISPDRKFRRTGRAMVRGSIGGSRKIEIKSSLPKAESAPNDSPGPRLRLQATPSCWDPETETLTLNTCEVTLDAPTFSTVMKGETEIRNFAGFQSEGLSASLTLRAGETTVIGSLGGEPVYIALRFTVN